MNLKVMKLDSWQRDYAGHEQGLPAKHRIFKKKMEEQLPYMVESYPRLGFSARPDGQYLLNNYCTFVLNGVEYMNDAGIFKYCMSLLSNYEAISRTDHIRQLYKLEIEFYGKPSDESSRLMSAIHATDELREMSRWRVKWKKKLAARRAATRVSKLQ